jgi:hypothetical protein
MTTIAAGRLSETLQALVDARLDTIDRMLLGRVNRHDRLAIVREVETQIFDLLQGRDSDSIDRDDVLAVLARLDPPEAYLPDEESEQQGRAARVSPVARVAGQPRAKAGWMSKTSGILGILGIFFVMVGGFTFFFDDDGLGPLEFVTFFGSLALTFVIAPLAMIFASVAKVRDGWAITGLVTGIVSMLGLIIFIVLLLTMIL